MNQTARDAAAAAAEAAAPNKNKVSIAKLEKSLESSLNYIFNIK